MFIGLVIVFAVFATYMMLRRPPAVTVAAITPQARSAALPPNEGGDSEHDIDR